jgi:trimeric autotransporter adhesin
MQINKNRKGLALGAVFALVASLFVASAPAQANEDAAVIFPTSGTASQTTMLITEQFDFTLRYGTGVAAALRAYAPDTSAGFGVIITKPAGTTISANANGYGAVVTASDIAGTTAEVKVQSSLSATLAISLADKTSVSPAVSITVQAFLDLDKDGEHDAGEPLGNTMTVNFVPWSAMGVALTLSQPFANDTGATASFTATAGSLNWSMLDDDFRIHITHSQTVVSTTVSSAIDPVHLGDTADRAVTGTYNGTAGLTDRGGYSASFKVLTSAFTTSATSVQSLSAAVEYNGEIITSTRLGVTALDSNGVSISPVVSANVKLNADGEAEARFNSAFTVRAFAYSASVTTSLAVPVTVTVSAQSTMEMDADSGVILNGVTYTSSAALLAAGFTLAAGTTTFTLSTFGQEQNTGGTDDRITLVVSRALQSDTLRIDFEPTALAAEYTPTTVSGLAGVSKTFALAVADQWDQATARTDLRVAAHVVLGGSKSDTVAASVVASAASVEVTPVPATRTGSATVVFALQRFDQDIQQWLNFGTGDTVLWNVFSYAAGTDAFVSRTASISASISYVASGLSWSPTAIAVRVVNSFSDVVVSAPGLMIRNKDLTTQTASDTLTVNAANGQTVNLEFTGRTAGTFTVTFTNGSATTTSQVVVHPAADNAGATVTFDTTAIPAGSTRVITGTLTDANGNPVNTSGSATILVTYTVTGNAGIPIGTMPTETDADGKFTFTVLTGANDSGTAVASAAYYKSGAATAVANVLTFNQSIVVGGAAAPATDQKLTVGSFKGFVAIYALNYTGQKLSAKVAGKWLVVESLTRFQRVVRNTGAAIPIVVDLYIDGKMVRTENIVTK